MSVAAVASEALGAIRARGTYRRMRVLDGPQAPRIRSLASGITAPTR